MSASCSRPTCQRAPVATLVYDYASRLVTLGPLAAAHPMHYDLCDLHVDRLSVPWGWSIKDVRVAAPVVDLHRRAS